MYLKKDELMQCINVPIHVINITSYFLLSLVSIDNFFFQNHKKYKFYNYDNVQQEQNDIKTFLNKLNEKQKCDADVEKLVGIIRDIPNEPSDISSDIDKSNFIHYNNTEFSNNIHMWKQQYVEFKKPMQKELPFNTQSASCSTESFEYEIQAM